MAGYTEDGVMYSDGKNLLMTIGYNFDVVKHELDCYHLWKDQPMELVGDLYGTVDEKCESIFCYLIEHVKYQVDADGVQYIKSPARLLADGIGDCKSFTMFIACCLNCLGIKHIIRFVNFDGGNQYTHVYPVAIDERGNEIILDACEKDLNGVILYNYARDYKKKLDFVFL